MRGTTPFVGLVNLMVGTAWMLILNYGNTTIMTYGQKLTFLIDNNSGFRVIIKFTPRGRA